MPKTAPGERTVTFNVSDELHRRFKAFTAAYGMKLNEAFPEALNLWIQQKSIENIKNKK
ncbi:MAG: hypothetical protein ACYTX0_51980 [Nostoc sp.]